MLVSTRHLIRDSRGVAAVEFALLLPILMLLYFGVVELTQGIMTQQRTSHVAATVGDLVSQSSTLTAADVADVFSVGSEVMYPYPTTSLKLRVSTLTDDPKGKVTVAWSQASGMTALTKGVSVSDLPSNVVVPGESVVMAESQYTYTSVFGQIMPKPVVFSQKAYSHPRLSTTVSCADC
ncbi:MAG: TadE/TadG family type IV pilus assembly protein [Caulobacteraceae bacterium]